MSGTFYTEKRLQGSAHANSNSPPESENSSVELAMNAHSNRIINIQVDSSNGLKSAPVGRDKNEEEETKSHPMQRFTIVQWLQLSLIPLFIFGLLAGLGCFGVISASNSYVSNQQAMASGILSDSATAFENQIYNAFSPMLTMEMVIRANPQYDYWLRNFNSTAAYLLNQTNGQRNSASFLLNMIQVQPHGMSKLNWPDSPGLMEASCIDMLGYPDPSGAAFFLSIVAAHNGPGIMGPMVQDDPYLNITYSASAWVMWPVFITGVDITEDFGYPWSDSPAAMACVANGQCYNATTRTKWWGFVTSFIDYSMVTYGTDAKIQGLVAKGFSYRVYAPANPSIGRTSDFMIGSSPTPLSSTTILSHDIVVPKDVWRVEISPSSGSWEPSWKNPLIAAVIVISAIIAALVFYAMYSAKRQAQLLSSSRAANERLSQTKAILEEEKVRTDALVIRQLELIQCLGGSDKNSSVESAKTRMSVDTVESLKLKMTEKKRSDSDANNMMMEMHEVLGEGTFGKVYKGLWRGTVVAIKTMVLPANMSGQEKREKMAMMEAAISSSLAHPNIVVTYTYSIKPVTDQSLNDALMSKMMVVKFADDASNTRGSFLENDKATAAAAANIHSYEVRLVIEFCDKGCLRSALDSGAFMMNNGLNYAAVLDTARDIASAMAHIHESGILHSDLKALNIMLKSDGSDPRGFVAKVADFGLALQMNRDETHASGLFQGTLSHMAPEVMTEGRQSKAADVYAYGILLWELFTASKPWQDINCAHLGHAISVERRRPIFPAFTPPDLKRLAERCWSHFPDQRPSFEQVHQELVKMRKALNISTTPRVTIKHAPLSNNNDFLLPVLIKRDMDVKEPPADYSSTMNTLAAQIEALQVDAAQMFDETLSPSPPRSGVVRSAFPSSKQQAYATGAIVVGDTEGSMRIHQSIRSTGLLPSVVESPQEGRSSEDNCSDPSPSGKTSIEI